MIPSVDLMPATAASEISLARPTIVDTYPPFVRGLGVEWCNANGPWLQEIAIGQLTLDCQLLDPRKLLDLAGVVQPPPISVVKHGNNYFVWDGRHRVMMAMLRGWYYVEAWVQVLKGEVLNAER